VFLSLIGRLTYTLTILLLNQLILLQAELDFYNREESHRRLQQESDATGYRANISDEAWDIEQGYISSVASELAYEFVELAPAILGGGVLSIN
jgi:hypothetical protein